jgi:hypothetical protein
MTQRLDRPLAVGAGSPDPTAGFEAAFTTNRDKRLGISPTRKRAYSLRPMKLADMGRALRIAADNFRGEVGLISRSYLWHFSRRVGLGNFGSMWSKQVVEVSGDGARASFELLSSFVHGRDVVWIDLADQSDDAIDLALEAVRHWPHRHRMLIVRLDRARAARFENAGFATAGRIPDGEAEHIYLHADRRRIASIEVSKVKLRFRRRRHATSDCEFSVVEREGSILGLTGIYETDFWRDVTWGAWGAMDRASARRDAVFETLRLTEERARANGARWFCLETSDDEKYRHARRIYQLYGLVLLMSVPNFYDDGNGTAETLMVYGKPLVDELADVPAVPVSRNDKRLAA